MATSLSLSTLQCLEALQGYSWASCDKLQHPRPHLVVKAVDSSPEPAHNVALPRAVLEACVLFPVIQVNLAQAPDHQLQKELRSSTALGFQGVFTAPTTKQKPTSRQGLLWWQSVLNNRNMGKFCRTSLQFFQNKLFASNYSGSPSQILCCPNATEVVLFDFKELLKCLQFLAAVHSHTHTHAHTHKQTKKKKKTPDLQFSLIKGT